jgi:hypothetical protein
MYSLHPIQESEMAAVSTQYIGNFHIIRSETKQVTLSAFVHSLATSEASVSFTIWQFLIFFTIPIICRKERV